MSENSSRECGLFEGELKSEKIFSKAFSSIKEFDLRVTVGTGSFGRVRVVKIHGSQDRIPFALKILKKSEVLRMKQVDHVKSEREILLRISHPFIVHLKVSMSSKRVVKNKIKRAFVIFSTALFCKNSFRPQVNLFCTFQDPKRLFMLMEYVNGGELFT